MMRLPSALLCLACCFGWCVGSAVESLNVAEAYDLGVQAIEQGRYDEGLKAVDAIIADYAETGKETFGPVFGHFYYLKGMLHIRKEQYEEAIAAFRTCFEQFPNLDAEPEEANRFRAESLVQWAGCLMKRGDPVAAAEKYRSALQLEESLEPKIDREETQINLSKALILGGREVNRGRDYLLQQLEAEGRTDEEKRSLFLILMADWSPEAPFPEVRQQIEKHRELMTSAKPVSRYRQQNPVYHSLAARAIAGGDPDRALAWYELMIDPVEVGRLYRSRMEELEKMVRSGRLDAVDVQKAKREITSLRGEMGEQRRLWGEMLMGRAAAHHARDEHAEAKADYAILARQFPNHPKRALILHNLAICAVKLGGWDEAVAVAERFLEEFPEHELRLPVEKLLIEVLFVQEQYDEALRAARKLSAGFSRGDGEREIPEFVAGASSYHLERFGEAETILERYLRDYPEGGRVEPATFYLGAAQMRLQRWAEAVNALDAFLQANPVSELRPAALYFSGLCHLAMENLPLANSRMIELQARHPEYGEVPNSYNILGDILTARGREMSEAVEAYQTALDLVEEEGRGDPEVGGYALMQLISLAAGAEQWEAATGHYDRFVQSYDSTSWRSGALIEALESLSRTGREEEARERLIRQINEYAEAGDAEKLDQIFPAYLEFLPDPLDAAERTERLGKLWRSGGAAPPVLEAWLILAEAEATADGGANGSSGEGAAAFSRLDSLYRDHGEDLGPRPLVELGKYHLNRGDAAASRGIFEEILQRRTPGKAAEEARLELAKLEATDGSPVRARELFLLVLNESVDANFREEAVLGMARLAMAKEDFEAARDWWEQYRAVPEWRRARAEAGFQFGICLLRGGKRDEAAATFVNVYSNFPAQLDWSTRAYIETAKILRTKGEELDSLKLLREMIQRLGHFEHPGIEQGRELFYRWRDELLAKSKGR